MERPADYPWSSYRALAYGRGGPSWFDRQRVYTQFDLDGKRFRDAVRGYDDEGDGLLSHLYYGLVMGSPAIVEDVRQRLQRQREPEKPQWRALRAHGSVAQRLREYGARLEISEEELAELVRPVRHRERPYRDALMYVLWQEGCFRLGQIAPHFGVGYTAVEQACRRAERRLKTDHEFRRRLQAITG